MIMRYNKKWPVLLVALFTFVTFGCASLPSGDINVSGEAVVKAAMKYIGRPYRHGTAGPNVFDCSGFTSFIYKQFDISLSRDSRAQYRQGVSVGRKDLRVGDLVFFTSPRSGRSVGHVGIVSKVESDGNFYFVHAARRGVIEDSYRASSYYYNRYVGARRVISDKDTLAIAMCGDIMMGTTYPSVQLPDNDGRDIFLDTKELTTAADIAVGNLEGAITDGGHCTKGNGPNTYAFRMPTSYGHLLGEAGYDYLSLANNHANDFDTEGIASTEQVLEEQGIKFSGIEGRTESAVVERDGIRYGLCAFGHNSYTLKHKDLATVKRILDDLKKKSDVVVVSFHGGAEGRDKRHLPIGTEMFLGEDRGNLREFTHFCIDNGADVVFGHGPHVCRAMEVYQGKFIAYSLGNFCTPYGMSLTSISAYAPVVTIKIDRKGRFLEGKIHSFIQQKGVGPRKDNSDAVAREIKELTESDIQGSPIRIDGAGNITLADE